jgi:hypothetical protein
MSDNLKVMNKFNLISGWPDAMELQQLHVIPAVTS